MRRIDDMMRLGVARKEALQLEHFRRLRLPDQHRSGRACLDERNASENESADDALAEVSLGDDQRAQLVGRDQQRIDVFVRISVN
jgi:hypothetical protein